MKPTPRFAPLFAAVGAIALCACFLVPPSPLPGSAAAKGIDELIDDANRNRQGLGESDGAGNGNAVCVTRAGPLGCTGRFDGKYDLSCQTTGGGDVKDYGIGSLSFLDNGDVELRLASKSPVWGDSGWTGPGSENDPIRGRVDSSGHILIEKQDDEVSLRWEGRFSLSATAGGQRPTGKGAYQSKGVWLDGTVVQTCQGTFTLDDAAAPQ